MGAELVAWKPGRTVVLLVALALIAGAASRPCPKARRSREADFVGRIRRLDAGVQRTHHTYSQGANELVMRALWSDPDVCGSLDLWSTQLRFDIPRMRAFCDVLSRD